MNKKSLFFILLSIVLLFLIFWNIMAQDKYFPYWDAYNVERFSNILIEKDFNLTELENYNPNFLPKDHVYSPLFFYNTNIFQSITGLDFYFLIFYSPIIFIFLLTLSIYITLREYCEDNPLSKSLIILVIIYYFTSPFSLNRFSMGLRENLVFFIGLSFLILYRKFIKDKTFNLSFLIMLTILYSYILMGNLIVFLIISGIIFISFIDCFKDKEVVKKLVFLITFTGIISLPVITLLISSIINQFFVGESLVESQGFLVSYFFINSSYFRVPVDVFWVFLGLPTIFLAIKKSSNKDRVWLYGSLSILLGIALSYIEFFGSKQNRFAIYLYLILGGIMLVYSTTLIKSQMINKKIILIFFTFIIIFLIITSTNYKAYRPLNERNIQDLSSNFYLIEKYDKWYCARSSEAIILYLGHKSKCDVGNLKDVLGKNRNLDGPIVLTSDDIFAINQENSNLLGAWLNTNYLIYHNSSSGNLIIFPENIKNDSPP